MAIPKNRPEKLERDRHLRIGVVTSCTVIGLLGIVICGYGHAAVNSDLYITGDATVAGGGTRFTSVYMQDLTPSECAAVADDATAQMIDKRDGNKYYVQKMRDGGCWMAQDLRFDLKPDANGKIELTSELSDINPTEDNWTLYEEEVKNGQTILKWNENSLRPPTQTNMRAFGAAGGGSTSAGSNIATTRSWHLRDQVRANPRLNSNNSGGRVVINLYDWDENDNEVWLYQPGTGFANNVSYDDETMTYNPHYHIGNYYQHMTATAGSRDTNTEAVSSICPKGWGLPKFTGDDSDPLTSYPSLTIKLYANDSGTTTGWPFYFAQGAYYLNSNRDASFIGSGYYWTSYGMSGGNARYIATASNAASATYNYAGGYWGMTVRCGLRMPTENQG